MYWLCITNSENWEVTRSKLVWGVSDRHRRTLARVKKGDFLVFYKVMEASGDEIHPPQVVGAFRAASNPFYDAKPVFKGDLYPHRVRVEPYVVPEKPVNFRDLIPKLEFIKNKRRWHTHLFGRAMRQIPERDFELILEALRGA